MSGRRALAEALSEARLGLRRGVVSLAEPEPSWRDAFERVALILRASAPASVVAVEHIGSTTVPGLPAKPILDIAVGLDHDIMRGADLPEIDAWLSGLDFFMRGDANGVRPDRMYGYELEPMIRLVNLHVLEHGSPAWDAYIGFRDRLRTSDAARDAYADLKRALAATHADDRIAYVEAKGSFIVETVSAARDGAH